MPAMPPGARRTVGGLVAAAVGLLLLAGCALNGPLPGRLAGHVRRPQAGAVLFICDGMGWTTVERGCREGWLPNIQQRFIVGGTHVEHAAAAVPPITYAAIATMLTGYEPEDQGILGNRWFDPDTACFRNYTDADHYEDVDRDCTQPTIYDDLGGRISINIQTAFKRGVTKNFANWAPSGVMWFFEAYSAVDKMSGNTLPEVADWANRTGRWPDLLTCYFPGGDSVGHRDGPDSAEFQDAAEKIDVQVGRICDWLERQGLLATTNLVLVSDHGMVQTHAGAPIDLIGLVRDQWGRNATEHPKQNGSEACRRAFYDRFDTVVAYQNGRGAFLYFKGPDGWKTSPSPEVVEQVLNAPAEPQRLWNLTGIDVVTYLSGDEEAVLRSARGQARVIRRGSGHGAEYKYEPTPDDVLKYMGDPALAEFIRAGFHTSREWLRATAEQRVVDLVPHVVPLLHVRRAGQVVLFTKPGYSFVAERGGHGGIDRDEMLMTFLVAGPGVPAGGRVDVARATDVTPTLLDFLGVPCTEDQWPDAISLVKEGLGGAGKRRVK